MSVSEKVYLSFQLHQEKCLAARHINNRVSWSPHIHIWMYYVIKTAKSILGKPNFGILENWSGQSVRYTPRSVFLHLLRTRSKSRRAVTYPRRESRLVTKWCPPPYCGWQGTQSTYEESTVIASTIISVWCRSKMMCWNQSHEDILLQVWNTRSAVTICTPTLLRKGRKLAKTWNPVTMLVPLQPGHSRLSSDNKISCLTHSETFLLKNLVLTVGCTLLRGRRKLREPRN